MTFSLGITKLQKSCVDYTYKLEFVTSDDHPNRSVAFLVSEDKKINAIGEFNRLEINTERHFRTRFDTWRDGKIYKDWYHGWDKSEFSGKYTKCFVFEYKSQSDRFYGFLCNPKKIDRSYQLCVLVTYQCKTRHKTDQANLKKVEIIRTTFAVQKVIKDYFKRGK